MPRVSLNFTACLNSVLATILLIWPDNLTMTASIRNVKLTVRSELLNLTVLVHFAKMPNKAFNKLGV